MVWKKKDRLDAVMVTNAFLIPEWMEPLECVKKNPLIALVLEKAVDRVRKEEQLAVADIIACGHKTPHPAPRENALK